MVPASTHRLEPSRAVDLFTPKLITTLREGYHLADLRADVLAGLTVAIVALPLSMAIAIASGVTPERTRIAPQRAQPPHARTTARLSASTGRSRNC